MKYFILLLCSILLMSCSNYEMVGNHKYKIDTVRANIGEFGGLILNIKEYRLKDSDTVSMYFVTKSQKLYFEGNKDSIFSLGKINTKIQDNKVIIITKEININGYEKFTNVDSIVRVYQQFDNGEIKLNKVSSYKSGKEIVLK